MIADLGREEQSMTPWERSFLSTVQEAAQVTTRHLSDRQVAKIDELWERYCGKS